MQLLVSSAQEAVTAEDLRSTGGEIMAEEQKAAKAEKKEARAARKDDNIVYVGKKPTMSYVLAVITQFSDGVPEVNIKARGRSISRAVDVVEVVRNRFVQGIKYGIEIGTEEVQDEQRSSINVSTINIKLKK
jgi:DNA-binding protein